VGRDKTGKTLEQAVGRIQQMLDLESVVTYREKIINRLGIPREFDVVVRGRFAGQPMLGVIECKDWADKVGTPEIDAFITKTQDINANLRMIVSPKGFTEPALTQAKDAGVGVFSLLPDDPNETGFSIGVLWYARAYRWSDRQYQIRFYGKSPRLGTYSANETLYKDAPIVNVFEKELSTTYLNTTELTPIHLRAVFQPYIKVTIRGDSFRIAEINVHAERLIAKKRRFMQMTGDALYNWETKSLDIPKTGSISIHGFDPNLPDWEDYDGEIPETGSYQLIVERYWGCIDLEVERVPEIPKIRIKCSRG
jgi:Restriction endonuclease